MTHIRLKHTYGSGHLHGLSAPDLHLEIALEPNALHRETQRRLSLSTGVSTGDHTQPLILERGYPATGQVDHLALRSPHSAGEQHYQYDALGRMTFRTQQHSQGQGQTSPTIAYNYDKAGRLIGSQHGHDAHRYPVDAAGNRSAASSSTPNATNQLAQLNGTRYRYDGAGNLIHREHPDGERLTLGYDGANRLVQLTHISKLGYTRHASYRYDGLGRRINKTVSHTDGTTAPTHYGWGGDRIVREETSNQRTTVVYEPGSFVPMLRIDQRVSHNNGTAGANEEKQVSAYITDALGTPLQLLSPNGQPRWLAEPDDWAAVTNQRAVRGVTQPIRFQGQWHDEESGLYYNRHRYYDPEQGRYISQDPIGLNGGTNLYGYVTNPTGMVDPLGLNPRAIVTAAQTAEKVRNVGWCIGQDVALNNSRDQLPDILEEEMDAARQSRAIDLELCRQEKRNRRIFGTKENVNEGKFNPCQEDVAEEYNDRVGELTQRDAARHTSINDGLNGIFTGCAMPNPADLDIPTPRSR